MPSITNTLINCLLSYMLLIFHIPLNRLIKGIIWASIIGNDSPELSYNAIIFKNRKKNRELVLSAIAKHFLKSKKGLLLL